LRQLHEQLANRNDVCIVVVAQKEPHAGQMAFRDVDQPQAIDERRALAQRMKDELELPMLVLVDSMDDQSRERYSDLPSPAFVIDRDGRIAAKFPWADADQISAALAPLIGEQDLSTGIARK
jgi:hypothetical protein